MLAAAAAERGLRALACTDTNGVYGAVEFQRACEAAGVRPILGAHLVTDDEETVALATNERGWAALCRAITRIHWAKQRSASITRAAMPRPTALSAPRHRPRRPHPPLPRPRLPRARPPPAAARAISTPSSAPARSATPCSPPRAGSGFPPRPPTPPSWRIPRTGSVTVSSAPSISTPRSRPSTRRPSGRPSDAAARPPGSPRRLAPPRRRPRAPVSRLPRGRARRRRDRRALRVSHSGRPGRGAALRRRGRRVRSGSARSPTRAPSGATAPSHR